MEDSTTAGRKYVIRTLLFLGGYAALNLAAITGAFDDLRPPATWVFAAGAAAPVVGHIWALLAYMRDADEFLGALMARRMIVATGLSAALLSVWGLMEVYAGAEPFPVILFYPLLWAAFGVATPFVRTTR